MKSKYLFIIFVVIAVLQLFAPANMIYNQEHILKTGTLYKFKTQPIDPNDPFRGKYVTLSYELNSAKSRDSTLQKDDKILVYLEKDNSGYAQVKAVSKTKIENEKDFIEVKVDWYNPYTNDVGFSLPFNRYYMQEFKAKPAENIYRKYNSVLDTINQTYALVSVKNGDAVLKEVYINDRPLLNYLELKTSE